MGSVNERPGITGISHFFEHMMFKGTDTIGTRDPAKDARYRAEQKAIRDEINRIVWTRQYDRFYRGRDRRSRGIPPTTRRSCACSAARLDALIQAQQGRGDGGADGGHDRQGRVRPGLHEGRRQRHERLHEPTTSPATSSRCPSNKLELWAWMESDRLHDSVFREFYSERDVVHEERRLRTDSTPTGRFQEQFDAMFWASCGYAWPVIGWPSDLNSYTFEQAQDYWNIYYRPGNLVGIVVGDFDPAEAKAFITSYFSRLEPGTKQPPPVVTLEVEQLAEQRMNAEGDFPPAIEIRYHTVPAGHVDSYPLDMLAEVLNERTGRLYTGLVEGRGIAVERRSHAPTPGSTPASSPFEAETRGDATPGAARAGLVRGAREAAGRRSSPSGSCGR